MAILQNPLTIEERAKLLRSYGHDLKNSANILSLNIENGFELSKPVSRRDVLHKTNMLYTLECISQFSDCPQIYTDKTDIERVISSEIKRLAELYPFEIINNLPEKKELELFCPGIWTVVSNLVRNAKNNGYNKDNWEKTPGLSMTIEYKNLFPETATFIPNGSRDYKDFIAFKVHDTGRGFPQDKNWPEYFTRCPPKGEHGFGLYFTGLVAKVLRAPVEIQSVPGDTTISFYHPVFEEN